MKFSVKKAIVALLFVLLLDKYVGKRIFFTPISEQLESLDLTTSPRSSSNDSECSSIITVATIDTGVDLKNPRINKIVKKDENGNPIGKSFGSNETVQDIHGHGTHIADLITRADNCIRIVPFSYYVDPSLEMVLPTKESFNMALEAAIAIHPDIINISGGGYGFSIIEFALVKKAELLGITIVAAAGNNGKNIDAFSEGFFPGSYKTSNIISVGAITSDGSYFERANYGKSVDIAALGKDVSATGLNGETAVLSGTSQATAIVCGAIAKAMLKNRTLGVSEIKNLLFSSADKHNRLSSKVNSGRVLNQAHLVSAAIEDSVKKQLQFEHKYSIAQVK
jgi:subtilisin family serine protease